MCLRRGEQFLSGARCHRSLPEFFLALRDSADPPAGCHCCGLLGCIDYSVAHWSTSPLRLPNQWRLRHFPPDPRSGHESLKVLILWCLTIKAQQEREQNNGAESPPTRPQRPPTSAPRPLLIIALSMEGKPPRGTRAFRCRHAISVAVSAYMSLEADCHSQEPPMALDGQTTLLTIDLHGRIIFIGRRGTLWRGFGSFA
jgi:hypothetical protein